MVGRAGIEPATNRLKGDCSTTELPAPSVDIRAPKRAARAGLARWVGEAKPGIHPCPGMSDRDQAPPFSHLSISTSQPFL